jgi:UDP-N-acetylmuramate--alanine ligase
MYHPDRQHLHFIGIGGVGMAGIAEVLLNLGYSVSGSDLKSSPLTAHLEELGAKIYYSHAPANIPDKTTVTVISSAISPENAEFLAARERGLPVLPRAEMLAELMRMKYGVAVAGAHGKTSTTTMVGHILESGHLDPTVIVGGRVISKKSGARVGEGKYLVAEADESDGSFVYLKPAISIVTNIDEEHLSHYGTLATIEEAFVNFMRAVPFYGLIVACADDPKVRRIAEQVKRRVVFYGFAPDAVVRADDVRIEDAGSSYNLWCSGELIGRFTLPLPGRHMVSNALAAIGVGIELGMTPAECAKALENFPGVARRSEVVVRERGITVIDDYGHHPTEIAVTLDSLKKAYVTEGRLIVLFQPHRYSRTKELFSQFLSCFSAADELVVGEIYSAGEAPIPGVSGEVLARAIESEKVQFVADLKDAIPGILKTLRSGDVVVTLGAGNVSQLSRSLREALASH